MITCHVIKAGGLVRVEGPQKNTSYGCVICSGTLETTRTFDPLLRRQMLYPAELRGHFSDIYIKYKH